MTVSRLERAKELLHDVVRSVEMKQIVGDDQPIYLDESSYLIGEIAPGCDARMEGFDLLNPAFTRWLMGFPKDWDACADMATRSFRQLQSDSSKRQSQR